MLWPFVGHLPTHAGPAAGDSVPSIPVVTWAEEVGLV